MKVTFKDKKKGKWKNAIHVKNMIITSEFIIFNMMNNKKIVIERNNVKFIRLTKLYEK